MFRHKKAPRKGKDSADDEAAPDAVSPGTSPQEQSNGSSHDSAAQTLPPTPPPKSASKESETHVSSHNGSPSAPSKPVDPDARKHRPIPYVRAAVRPSTSASSVPTRSTLSAHAHPFQHTNANASVASEAWNAPEDADGAYVRRTYAHFDQRGVRGDGLVEGKEWTRERGPKAAWEDSIGKSATTANRDRRLSMPPTTQPFALKSNGMSSSKDSPKVRASTRDGRLSPLPSGAVGQAEGIQSLSLDASLYQASKAPQSPSATTQASIEVLQTSPSLADREHSFGASTSSLGTHSEESVSISAPKPVLDEGDSIDLERRELMTKIDRYGFFPRDQDAITNSSRSRMTILAPNALQHTPRRRLKPRFKHGLHRNGAAQNNSANDSSLQSTNEKSGAVNEGEGGFSLQDVIRIRREKESHLRQREAMRERKWDRMLVVERAADGQPMYALRPALLRSSKLRRRVYKGIPDRWRAAVWWAMLQGRPHASPASEYDQAFVDLERQPSPHDVQIDLDVPRTISGHILFHTRYGQGQRALFHVLHAFSLLCADCAYCQGMGPIVATLLVYFAPAKAYAVMVELHKSPVFGLHQTFSPGFPGLVENFYAQMKLAQLVCPDVLAKLDDEGIVTSAYATKWYITLFTNVFPFATQLRLWDAYFAKGKDVLVVTAVAVLWCLRVELLKGNFETCMNMLGSEFVPVDDDLLLNWIYVTLRRDDTRKCLAAARRDWASMVERGQDLPIL